MEMLRLALLQALEDKYGKLCTEWVAEKEQQQYTNSTTTLAAITKTPECGSREFWFFKGEDQGTKEKFMETACNAWVDEKKTQNYTNNPKNIPAKTNVCGDKEYWFFNGEDQESYGNLQSAECEADRENLRASGFNGIWGPKEGPGVCSEKSYICDKAFVSEYDYYKTCGVKAPPKCKGILYSPDQDCIDYELSDYWYKKCGPRPKDPKPKNCRFVGQGKPKDSTGWDKTPQCGEWARCTNLY